MTDAGVLHCRTVVRYGIGSVGTAAFGTLPGLVLVYYLTDTLGVPALAAGIVIAVAKIWDVVIDPAIGFVSDRHAEARGSRRPLMLLCAAALPAAFLVTFAVPGALPTAAQALWVAVAFLLSATAFSLFQVPYIALPAELTDDYDQRTRLLTVRVVVLALGILVFGAGGPALRDAGSSEAVGYLLMAAVTGVLMGVSMWVASRSADDARRVVVGDAPVSPAVAYRAAIAALRRSRALRMLLGAFVLQGLATGLMLAGAQYIATWVLDSESAVSVLFAALIAPALICTPLWGAIARRWGKEVGFVAATALFALAAVSLAGLWWSSGPWVYGSVAVAGAAYAGMQALPMAMLPDVIGHDEATHGESAAGTIGGVWTAGETSGMALGSVLFTLALAIGGYISSDEPDAVIQPGSALDAMIVGFSVLPAVLALVSVPLILRYPLRRTTIETMNDKVVAGD